MASKSHTHAPHTTVRGGVNSPFSPAINKVSKGSQGTMKAPFDAARAGSDKLPTKIYQDMGEPKKMPKPSRVLTASPEDKFGPTRRGSK